MFSIVRKITQEHVENTFFLSESVFKTPWKSAETWLQLDSCTAFINWPSAQPQLRRGGGVCVGGLLWDLVCPIFSLWVKKRPGAKMSQLVHESTVNLSAVNSFGAAFPNSVWIQPHVSIFYFIFSEPLSISWQSCRTVCSRQLEIESPGCKW